MVQRDPTIDIRRALAPGTPLRNAVEIILRQRTGALIVLGYGRDIESICNGGFHLDGADFGAARLAELAKMDGAVITDEAAEVIYRANVQLVPDSEIATSETGTRHRTAERVAAQTGRPCVVVSEERQTVTVYVGTTQFELRSPTTLLAQANQNLLTLERLRSRLDDDEEHLTTLEVDDIVTYRDVVRLLHRAALVRRVGADLDQYAVELGGDGQLIRVQIGDLLFGVDDMAVLVYRDYARKRPSKTKQPLDLLNTLTTEQLSEESRVASAINLGSQDAQARPRGYRLLSRVPRLPDAVKDSLVGRYGNLQGLLHAKTGDLDQVEGVGRARARQLRHYFDRLLERTRMWEIEED
jgi:diadenylate cyclase